MSMSAIGDPTIIVLADWIKVFIDITTSLYQPFYDSWIYLVQIDTSLLVIFEQWLIFLKNYCPSSKLVFSWTNSISVRLIKYLYWKYLSKSLPCLYEILY